MPLIRKRRSRLHQQADPDPSPHPTRRRRSASVSDASSIQDAIDGFEDEDNGGSSQEQMVKKLVRLALASEYSRVPIRRGDIAQKGALWLVMAPNAGRQFKQVFNEAQVQLREVFGMEMTELPMKEKVTVSQKRAAARQGTQSQNNASSNAYVLTSTLASRFRTPSILIPSRIPTSASEAAYTGLYTFVIALISLSAGGKISENFLERDLEKLNASNYVLNGEKTENVLKRMERQGYIVKVRERDGGGEESVDYVVGPRGKAEVGEKGVAGLIRGVYDRRDTDHDELERRLVRSLGDVVIEKKARRAEDEGEEDADDGGGANGHAAPEEEEEQSSRRDEAEEDGDGEVEE
ncbi:MAG: hypothetical protein Q9191_007523 [Dirinaria sp. TL-2023a]